MSISERIIPCRNTLSLIMTDIYSHERDFKGVFNFRHYGEIDKITFDSRRVFVYFRHDEDYSKISEEIVDLLSVVDWCEGGYIGEKL